jgi:hypothetical protein
VEETSKMNKASTLLFTHRLLCTVLLCGEFVSVLLYIPVSLSKHVGLLYTYAVVECRYAMGIIMVKYLALHYITALHE